ncbi:tRNA 5-methoxyuridine(34)/uridine 5-oxyacetic acid(34) synthase CmoB [Saccharophagus degradans]|uniref:tRNA U34 carboxymethyltransferase n=1 Tax=Saccharophagus degradans TaxID=86304 RepID=A0AAW7X462_9GAMM|nr:tRNA 5-methoxyuridine(34)/uridine 5-oxyacetic acid(34) synthase CmoB [Saccharophagus degradans]MBU2985526.1 tRNA 5-methoxyuridine(34)/uridine 5-oxyacetic acid(34) synthase CmoB [Saccharophagus degradans]MDO6421333.1 tRNA 5-methoxyuridine(34)/uridine 5-oxyacetic acid(34) synthase CmoB [Saccharophagus degradans]MDO6605756.1 tRNA 5-methoxyuridine(34)/uridine 5-oxyacetic acid(34) synthase CmoB [Saccharophagus degradans]
MIDYTSFLEQEKDGPLARWVEILPDQISEGLSTKRYGDLEQWLTAMQKLPLVDNVQVSYESAVTLKSTAPIAQEAHALIEQQFRALIPWRKGPYNIFDIEIDTEWHSDWKWDRVLPHLAPLKHRKILDVGCGNGYHCWRMYGEGASQVIGIDPSPRFVVQFYMLKHFIGSNAPVDLLPVPMEAVPANLQAFDTTFSMGVLYHRRSPMDHLRELKATLRPGGQLVLETLVIEGKLGEVLVPEGRYAMMNNVWFLPSVPTLISWLTKCGFKNARCVDVNQTSTDEQRSTEWMTFQSLSDFLDPNDPTLTAEGHPAPLRAVILAEAPE